MGSLKDTLKQRALEQIRRMTIYNWVMVTLTVVIVILGLALQPLYLLLLVLLALAGPLVREIGLTPERNERVTFISYRSSHIAFYITLLVIASVFVGRSIVQASEIEPEFFILLIVAVVYKFFAALGFTYDAKVLGLTIGYVMGALIAIMEALEGYFFTPQMFIPLLIILVTVVGHWYPKLAGSLFLLLGIGFIAVITRDVAAQSPMSFILQALVLGVPVLLAGLLLLFHFRMSGAAAEDFKEETPPEPEQ